MSGDYISKALKIAKKTAPDVASMSDEALAAMVLGISADLKGFGIGAAERIVLNEDRKLARAEIARRAAGQVA